MEAIRTASSTKRRSVSRSTTSSARICGGSGIAAGGRGGAGVGGAGAGVVGLAPSSHPAARNEAKARVNPIAANRRLTAEYMTAYLLTP